MRSEHMPRAVQLHTEVSGSGPVSVVLLHGLFGSASNLMSVARSLESHFTVVRMDLRNHGKSAHSDQMDIPVMAEDVIAAMDVLEMPCAHFLGHSLGGKVAMQVAITHPERVKRLIVADIAPVRYGRGHDAIITSLLALELRSLKNREQADQLLTKSVPEVAIRQFLLKNLMRDGKDGWAWRMNLPVIAELYDNLRDAPSAEPFDGPTLFIRGELSGYIRDENRAPMMRQFPNMYFETIANAGHWLHAEYPLIFNGLVNEFLRADGAA
ncbi:alpha/beta fold hydrolase [uncultured Zhongshania sp.]|uniref:alpha/beta fold hydrolase n=1 Tax=uncultured Zhongshania sp. TaxID=1642288 RepID=UPI0030D98A22|tara:strand:+ start:76 stop:879 length:804 start_codon:yes stop_codon:yes gene_type:complete